MKSVWQSVPLLFFYLVFCVNCSLAQDDQSPRLVVKDQVFDFKEVGQGEILVHIFKVVNTGGQLLEIKKVKPG